MGRGAQHRDKSQPLFIFEWTEARIETLKRMLKDGYSTRQIAEVLGNGATRNAVLGKAHRMGLSISLGARPAKKGTSAIERGEMKAVRETGRSPKPLIPYMPPDSKAVPPETWHALPHSEPIAMEHLSAGMCKWPIAADGKHLFCGAGAAAGKPYCPHHYELAHGKGTPSERDAIHAAKYVAKRERFPHNAQVFA